MSEPVNIPYRHGYVPIAQPVEVYRGPWPRPGAMPHSADAYFTNPDPRLRPFSIIAKSNYPSGIFEKSDRIEVTRFNFPKLHEQFMEMQQRAGLGKEPYKLFIGLHVPGMASIRKSGKTREITVDLGLMNRSDWDGLQFWYGHELGHAWQYANPAPRVPIRDAQVEPQQRYEATADIFSMCIVRDKEAILRGMNGLHIHSSGFHPGREARQNAARSATASDCAIFNLWPDIPYYLRRPEPPIIRK